MSNSGTPKATRRRFDSLEQEAFLSLWRTYDRLRALEEEVFRRHDLTPQEYNALRLLQSKHPQPIPTLVLASRLVSRAPDITRLLAGLQHSDLVSRIRLPEDGRVVQNGITKHGLALLRKLEKEVDDCHERQLGHLKPSELRRLIDLLRAVRRPHEPEDSNWL